jgi:integrase
MFISYIHQEDICIEDVTFIDVRNFFESRSEQNLAESTIQSDLSAIEGVINRYEAETDGMPVVSWKISQNIDPKDYSNGTKYDRVALTDEEITSLLKEVDDFRGKLMILVALELGPRSKAICLIEISEIDLEDQIIELRNTKSGGRYEMPLTDNLTSLLKHWINHIRSSYLPNDNNTYLFPSRKGGKLSSQSLLRFVQRAAEKADIQEKIGEISYKNRSKDKMKVDVHALRHTTGRLMKEQGISKDTRRYALDHSRDVTERYGFNKQLHIDRLKHKFDGVDTSDL